eukprot:SAG31_NODE_18226_length_643_cov_0.641544_2_plen_29_part_01
MKLLHTVDSGATGDTERPPSIDGASTESE